MTPDNKSTITIHSGQSTITIAQQTGKVLQLLNRETNLLVEPMQHEWRSGLEPNPSNTFDSSVAWGGDDCFPSVAASSTWDLRDHGSIWGQQPTIIQAQSNTCTALWKQRQQLLERTIRGVELPENAAALGAFEIEINFPVSLPLSCFTAEASDAHVSCLYAWHTLFAAQPGDILTWGTTPEMPAPIQLATGAWKIRERARRIFAPQGHREASKYYVETRTTEGGFVTSLLKAQTGIRVDVIQSVALPWVGIWWCHNGWGDGRPHSTVGIEPTNLPSDGPVLNFDPPANHEASVATILVVISKLQ
jgi:hypothetical protein